MKFPITESFKLTDGFVDQYKKRRPDFGFGGLGEFVYMRTYSRLKDNGKNEQWYETVRRVVEGVYTIQRQHIEDYRLGWNQAKAQKSAQEMYDRMFNFKMLGSGRAFWAMNTPIVMEKGLTEALYNCSFISSGGITQGNVADPFVQAMDFLMLGVGVGFDTRGAGRVVVKEPKETTDTFIVPDSREGWLESLSLCIESFFGGKSYNFDYSEIRKAGTPIKTFGGVSSGYKPLEDLHKRIIKTFTGRDGEKITQKDIADIINQVGVAVVSGNVRRSAEMLLGNHDDEFMELKNYDKNPERGMWGWASNNSVIGHVGMDYDALADKLSNNGEPAVIWLDNMRSYGRMKDDEKNNKDFRVVGVNPCSEITLEDRELCVSGDTRILTKNGYPKISDVVGKNVSVWNGEEWSKVTPFKVGDNVSLYRVHFSDGSYLDVTSQHKFSIQTSRNRGVSKNIDVETRNLQIGDTLEYLNFEGCGKYGVSEENAFEWGFFAGDGYLDGSKINAVLCGEKSKLVRLGLKGKLGKPQIKDGYTAPVNRLYLKDTLKDLELARHLNDKDKGIPDYFFKLNKNSILEFTAGWIETDGTIQKNVGSWHYRVYGSHRKMLDLQLLLRRAGISGVSVSLASKKGFLTNFGKRNRDLYYITIPSHECWKIPTRLKKIPNNLISSGFVKNNAHNISGQIRTERRQRVSKVERLEGQHSTYCFTEPKKHKGVFGNVITKQCNLVEVIPSRHESIEDFKKTIKYSYLFAKTITLLNTNWADTNKVMLRNRRIGLSMTGITQFVADKGLHELREWMNEGYDLANKYDDIYSEWFAVPKSIKLTTVKPSGTLSLLAGVTAGIHYPESRFYIRRVRLASNSPYVSVLKDSGYHVEPADEDKENTVVVSFPVKINSKVKTLDEVTMWEQLELASFAQENWADNSVSVTVTFKENEKSQIRTALEMFQFKLKSVSFLPKLEVGGAYKQMPYESITESEYEKISKNITPLKFKGMTEDSVSEMYCESDVCMVLDSN